MQCFGCFGADSQSKASASSPSDDRRSRSFRHRSTQVSDVMHLVGPAQPKQQNKVMAAMRAPQFGEHAYEPIGDVGNTQNAGDMKLARHKRSKELVSIKCIKHNTGDSVCQLDLQHTHAALCCQHSALALHAQRHASIPYTLFAHVLQTCSWTRMWRGRY